MTILADHYIRRPVGPAKTRLVMHYNLIHGPYGLHLKNYGLINDVGCSITVQNSNPTILFCPKIQILIQYCIIAVATAIVIKNLYVAASRETNQGALYPL